MLWYLIQLCPGSSSTAIFCLSSIISLGSRYSWPAWWDWSPALYLFYSLLQLASPLQPCAGPLLFSGGCTGWNPPRTTSLPILALMSSVGASLLLLSDSGTPMWIVISWLPKPDGSVPSRNSTDYFSRTTPSCQSHPPIGLSPSLHCLFLSSWR